MEYTSAMEFLKDFTRTFNTARNRHFQIELGFLTVAFEHAQHAHIVEGFGQRGEAGEVGTGLARITLA